MVSGGKRTIVRLIVTSALVLAVAATSAIPAAAAAGGGGGGTGAGSGDQPSDAQLQRNLQEGLAGIYGTAAAADADPSKFVDGDLVSDAVFFRGNAWPAATIQSFLDARASANGCAPAAGGPVCLNTFTATTPSKAGGAACAAYAGQANATAAQIFAGVGLACGINPVVLMALVQKEQGLVSTSTPTQWMYDHATGWNCPDVGADASCDSTPTSVGFFNQVYGAAWQFKQYGADPYFDWIPVGKVSSIRYNLDSTCGSKQVAIQNKATAALYYYTPYTPNAASLASYPGEGDDCSAYGIRNFWMLFNAWYGSSTAGSVPATTRISGADRFATSVAISQAAFPSPGAGIAAAYIANAYAFPDALAAAPAAVALGGPLLLSAQDSVPAVVLSEVQRLKPQKIFVAGGTVSLSDGVIAQLKAAVPSATVTRVAGADRFETSRNIAAAAFTAPVSTAYLASGLNFPDALSAGAAAGAQRFPVVLVGGSAPDTAIIQSLHALGVTAVKLIGGTAVIPDSYATGLTDAGFGVTRVSGADRFRTSLAVNADAFPTATAQTLYASSALFPDALSGAAYAGKTGSPLLVTPPGCVIPEAAELSLRSTSIGLLGGTVSLTGAVGALSICQ